MYVLKSCGTVQAGAGKLQQVEIWLGVACRVFLFFATVAKPKPV
jgi:hypothetical protein